MQEIPKHYPAEPVAERPVGDELFTERLRLRTVQPEDVTALTRLWTDPTVRAHLGGVLDNIQATAKATTHVGQQGSFAVFEKATACLLGLIDIGRYRTGDLEVSYQLLPEVWGKGYGREAVAAAIRWGFDHFDTERIAAVTQSANIASRQLLESICMEMVDEFEEFGEPQSMYAIGANRKEGLLRFET